MGKTEPRHTLGSLSMQMTLHACMQAANTCMGPCYHLSRAGYGSYAYDPAAYYAAYAAAAAAPPIAAPVPPALAAPQAKPAAKLAKKEPTVVQVVPLPDSVKAAAAARAEAAKKAQADAEAAQVNAQAEKHANTATAEGAAGESTDQGTDHTTDATAAYETAGADGTVAHAVDPAMAAYYAGGYYDPAAHQGMSPMEQMSEFQRK